MKQQHLSARQTHWLEDISPYANNMDIFYRRGETNRADGLSRRPDLDLSIAALQEYEKQYREQEYLMAVQEVAVFAGPTAEFVQQIREGYNRDPHFKGLTTGLRVENDSTCTELTAPGSTGVRGVLRLAVAPATPRRCRCPCSAVRRRLTYFGAPPPLPDAVARASAPRSPRARGGQGPSGAPS